jgi:hypothetical protein
MRFYIFLLALLLAFALSSCKTCIECECSKNGVKTDEKDCLYTNNKSGAARDFSNYLKREKQYDECICIYY